MRAPAAGELVDAFDCLLAALRNDISGAEFARKGSALLVAAEDDDLLSAEPSGRDHSAQAHCAVTDDGHGLARLFDGAGRPVNFARFVFLDPRAREFYADCERSAKNCVALLRAEAGRNPYDRELSDLVGELSTRSEEFRGHWATYDVRLHNKGEKRFNHPMAGEIELSYNRLGAAADGGLTIIAYTAEPGSKFAEAFSLLASWAATEETQTTASDAPARSGRLDT